MRAARASRLNVPNPRPDRQGGLLCRCVWPRGSRLNVPNPRPDCQDIEGRRSSWRCVPGWLTAGEDRVVEGAGTQAGDEADEEKVSEATEAAFKREATLTHGCEAEARPGDAASGGASPVSDGVAQASAAGAAEMDDS